jgi:hypothetical protein
VRAWDLASGRCMLGVLVIVGIEAIRGLPPAPLAVPEESPIGSKVAFGTLDT